MVLAAYGKHRSVRWKVVIGGSAFPRGLAAALAGGSMSLPVTACKPAPCSPHRAVADPDLRAQTAARTERDLIPLVDLRTVDA